MRKSYLIGCLTFGLVCSGAFNAQSGTIGVWGGNFSTWDTYLGNNGHTAVSVSSSSTLAELSALDQVWLIRANGDSDLVNYVKGGGTLVTEWNAAQWAIDTVALLDADVTNLWMVGTDTPITFTQSGLDMGLGDLTGNPYSNSGATEFFFSFSNIGADTTSVATIPNHIVGISGSYESGNVLLLGWDWQDVWINDPITQNLVNDISSISWVPELASGSPGYLFMSNPLYSWQSIVWQSSPTSTMFLLGEGCDANFIGSGSTYSVTLDYPVTVRDLGLSGGQLSLSSSGGGITLTDPRDGYSTIDVASGSFLAFNVPVTATGGVIRTGAGNVTFNSPLTVNNSLMLLSGVTVISSPASIGGTTSVGGSLTVNGTLSSGELSIGNTGEAIINNSASVSGATSVDGDLTVNGFMSTGTLDISSSGAVMVNNRVSANGTDNYGFLNVNGVLDSLVSNQGFLGGSGRINGSVYNHRVISPGNSIGTLTINGSYTHGSGATFIAEIDKNGGSDLLHVIGKANINGGSVVTSLPRALYPDGYSWNFLQASGGINGQFANLTGQPNSSTLSLSLDYTSTQANIMLARKSYASFSSNKGAQSIGYALDSYVPLASNRGDAMESLLITMDFDYSPATIANTLSALNPEMYPTFLAIEQQAALRFAQSMSYRNSLFRDQQESEVTEVGDWVAWGQAKGTSVSKDSNADYNDYDFNAAGVVVGVDAEITPSIRLGMATAVDKTDVDWQYGANGTQDNLLIGVYAKAKRDGYYADVQGSIGFYNNDTERVVSFANYVSAEDADFNGQSYMVRLGGGYDFQYDDFRIGPIASLSYLHLRTSDFSENGDNYLSLNIDEASENVLLSYLGIHTASKFHVADREVSASVELGWQHDFNGDEFEMEGWFDGYPSFTFSGPGLDQDMLIAQAEATVTLGQQLSGYVEIGGALGDDTKAYNATIGLQWFF